ncbi:uncharacterized protein LOC129600217 isoform X2 [Paramacrobiotus metropolitanus]|uniref:uncharacterized protein LOC129600217 isoform X2 n=1 Tax=Paramacrobiotus metropolitanus TaxID=2943436 RepID=UPI0024458BA7|nr:uncharacterized protein LOC129600217 isoform X2 [Paramacrobiotus metropolitanus]
MNFGNTVLVQRDNDQWWLGYVQDIDGDRFLVDFDSPTVRPEWILTRHIWPHNFLRQWGPQNRGSSIQVALRDTQGGPMVFRPATITREVWDKIFVALVGVRPDGANRACIVDICQIVTELPTHNEPSFSDAKTQFVYRKHVVPFEPAELLRDVALLPKFVGWACRITLGRGDIDTLCDTSCQFARSFPIDEEERSFQCTRLHSPSAPTDHRAFYCVDVDFRVFARVDTGTVSFVCAEVHGDAFGRSKFWTADALKEACLECLTAQKPRIRPGINSEADIMGTVQPDEEAVHINDLPYPILGHILLHFDVVTQLRLNRVCALWSLLLGEYAASQRQIILTIPRLLAGKPVQHEINAECQFHTYQVVSLLDRSLTVSIHTVVLLDDQGHSATISKADLSDFERQLNFDRRRECRNMVRLIRHILGAKDRRVPLLVIKNTGDLPEALSALMDTGRMPGEEASRYECRGLRQWMTVCRQLLLVDYNAAIPTGSGNSLMDQLFFFAPADLAWLDDSGQRAGDMVKARGAHLQIRIPFLRFHCTETAAEQSQRFITAVNDNCPPVSQTMTEKVTGMLLRWVRSLAYPDQWTGIRIFLNLFSSVGPDGLPQPWDGADLRQLNAAVLSRLAMHILDEFFPD